jgi:hypothetical protein
MLFTAAAHQQQHLQFWPKAPEKVHLNRTAAMEQLLLMGQAITEGCLEATAGLQQQQEHQHQHQQTHAATTLLFPC